ncbi:hypothetical protein D3C84_598860 [compost metagenome]
MGGLARQYDAAQHRAQCRAEAGQVLRAVIHAAQVVGGDLVDEHVFRREHDNLADRENDHGNHPEHHRGRQGKARQTQYEHAQPRRQPPTQVPVGNPSANGVLQADHRQRIGRQRGTDDPVSGLGRRRDHQVLRQVGRELAKDHGAEQPAEGEAD